MSARKFIAVTMLCSIALMTGCQKVHVYHTRDGSKAYKGADGGWYWYLSDSGSKTSTTIRYVRMPYSPYTAPSIRGPVVKEEEMTEEEFQQEFGAEITEAPDQSFDGEGGDDSSDSGGDGGDSD